MNHCRLDRGTGHEGHRSTALQKPFHAKKERKRTFKVINKITVNIVNKVRMSCENHEIRPGGPSAAASCHCPALASAAPSQAPTLPTALRAAKMPCQSLGESTAPRRRAPHCCGARRRAPRRRARRRRGPGRRTRGPGPPAAAGGPRAPPPKKVASQVKQVLRSIFLYILNYVYTSLSYIKLYVYYELTSHSLTEVIA